MLKDNRSHSTIGVKHIAHDMLVRIIVIFSITIVVATICFVIYRGFTSYNQNVTNAFQEISRTTYMVSNHVQMAFKSADLSLRRAIDRQYFNALFGNSITADITHNFKVWVNETPQISAMLMADNQGNVKSLYSKEKDNIWEDLVSINSNINHHESFIFHESAINIDSLYIGWTKSRNDINTGYIIISRRISNLDGSFGGVIQVAINADYMQKFLHDIEEGKSTKMILLRNDGFPMVNQLRDGREIRLLANILNKEKISANEEKLQTIINNDNYDQKLRLFAFNGIKNMQMSIVVIMYGDDIFAGWKTKRIDDIIFLAIFTFFVFIVSIFIILIIKQMDKAQRSERAAIVASQTKSDFLANMSHELRTPLNAIIGFSDMIEAGYFGSVNPKQKERIHDINFCGVHLLDLINDILEFSKGESGKTKLSLNRVLLSKVINDAIRVLNEKAKRKHIKISKDYIDNLPYVMADERKIKQILINLLSNSLKFTPDGGEIEVGCDFDGDKNLYFYVADNGEGMDETDIPEALTAFGQVHRDHSKGGTGLGLPLCKMFAELHGGDLSVISQKDKGTTVYITLPADAVVI